MARILDVYLHRLLAGNLTQDNSGRLSFQYKENYVKGKGKPPLSISLPLQAAPFTGPEVPAFFSGLLPDDTVRDKLARYLGRSSKNAFALLDAIGGECAGAISVFPEGHHPNLEQPDEVDPLTKQELGKLLSLLKTRPLMAGHDGVRLSLAGAQDKLAVRIVGSEIAITKGTTATTHILKPAIDGIPDSVHNELFCMRLAALMSIRVPTTEIDYSNQSPYLVVQRYDRVWDEQTVLRLHQEDFCQALSVAPELKYQREGGPSIKKCLTLIEEESSQPAVDWHEFIRRLVFNYIIGNADAHGKNFSLLYPNQRACILAPAYDLLSTEVYPDLSKKMAMKIDNKYDPDRVLLRHWQQIVPDTATTQGSLESHLKSTATTCYSTAIGLAKELNHDHPSPIYQKICEVIERRSKHILGYFSGAR